MRAAALWTHADIRRGWRSLLLVSLLAGLAGGAVMAGVAGARRAGTAVDRFVGAADLAAVVIYTDEPLDGGVARRLADDDRVDAVNEGRVLAITPVGVTPAMEGGMWSAPDVAVGGARTPLVLAGVVPSGPREVALDESTAHRLSIAVGDEFDIQGLDWRRCDIDGDAACDPIALGSVRLTGIVRTDQDIVADPEDWLLLLASDSFLDDAAADPTTMGWITSVWPAKGADPDALVAAYAPELTEGNITNDSSRTGGALSGAYRAAEAERDAVLAATLVAAVTGFVIVGQAHSRYLARRRSDVPALRAMGMTRADTALAAWMPGVIATAGGTALAVMIALALSPAFPIRTARTADPDLGVHADLAVLVPGVVLLLGIGAATSFAAAWSWSAERRSPTVGVTLASRVAQSMRLGPSPSMGVRAALERSIAGQRLPTLPTLLAAGCALLFATAAMVIIENLDLTLRRPAAYGVTWDLEVSIGSDPEPARAFASSDDRIRAATFIKSGELSVSTDAEDRVVTDVVGMESLTGRFAHTVLDGRAPAGVDEVAVSTEASRRLGVSVGDTVVLSGPDGARTVDVTGRVVMATSDSSTANGLLVDLALLDALGGDRTIAEIDVQPMVLVSAADPADRDAIRADIEAAGASVELPTRPTEVALLDEIRVVPRYLAVFVATLGALATFHSLWATSTRRRNELSVLRALGCRRQQTASVISWQAACLVGVAAIAGVPLGVAAGRAAWAAIADRREVVTLGAVPWMLIAVVVGAALLGAVTMLAILPVREVLRLRPAEELRGE